MTAGFWLNLQTLLSITLHHKKKHVTSTFVWNGVHGKLGICKKQCILCQSFKVQAHIKSLPAWLVQDHPVPIWQHSCGSCVITYTLQWLYPPSYSSGLIFSMTKSHPAQGHYHLQLCTGSGLPLVHQSWHSGWPVIWQDTSVNLTVMVVNCTVSGYSGSPNHVQSTTLSQMVWWKGSTQTWNLR